MAINNKKHNVRLYNLIKSKQTVNNILDIYKLLNGKKNLDKRIFLKTLVYLSLSSDKRVWLEPEIYFSPLHYNISQLNILWNYWKTFKFDQNHKPIEFFGKPITKTYGKLL